MSTDHFGTYSNAPAGPPITIEDIEAIAATVERLDASGHSLMDKALESAIVGAVLLFGVPICGGVECFGRIRLVPLERMPPTWFWSAELALRRIGIGWESMRFAPARCHEWRRVDRDEEPQCKDRQM
jgi:hypothetical protein